MFLRQLKLKNIRSYTEETVSFPQGSTLLSGDIGSGKSTLLLAIEFALFGTSRPDLPAETLLRKGSSQGQVELQFSLPGQEITIVRNLKKEKDAIKQTAGQLIVNGIRKELTALELKAEMISLLGYPEDYLAKNKNYIFRYTIYTPQEEMKLVLLEETEARIDTLRKIFNLDKYKTIRENLQNYLRQFRGKIAALKLRIEPLEETKNKIQKLQEEKKVIQQSLQSATLLFEDIQQRRGRQQQELEQIEKQQELFMRLQQRKSMILALLEEKELRKKELASQEITLASQQGEISASGRIISDKESLTAQLGLLEKEKSGILAEKASLQERTKYLRDELSRIQTEMKQNYVDASVLPEKEKVLQLLEQEVALKHSLSEKKKQLEELFARTLDIVSRNQALLSHSLELKSKLESLKTCPTCLQEVDEKHKQGILSEEEKKIAQAENLLFETKKQKSVILQQKEELELKFKHLLENENSLIRTRMELDSLKEKMQRLARKQEQADELIQKISLTQQELGRLDEKKLEVLDQDIARLRESLDLLLKQHYLEQQLKDISRQRHLLQEEEFRLNQERGKIELQAEGKEDHSEAISSLRAAIAKTLGEERLAAVEEAQLKTRKENLYLQEEESLKRYAELSEGKNQLLRLQELYHWLEEYFLPLTYTIEKQMMINIHSLFNQLFQEWFAIMIENENVYARIDDSFSPVIEQDGYEISFLNLSGGEKTSVALAYRLALNRVVNDVIQEIRTKDLLILDEPTDGFSSEQLDKVREVLDRLKLKQTIIVSHESKVESFVENVIRVHKEGNSSCILG